MTLWSGQYLRRAAGAAALVVAAALPQFAVAQPSGPDSRAVQRLKAATDFLAGQRQLSAETRNSIEVVLASGQKLQFDNTVAMAVQRPNKLYAKRLGDRVDQVFWTSPRRSNCSIGSVPISAFWTCSCREGAASTSCATLAMRHT